MGRTDRRRIVGSKVPLVLACAVLASALLLTSAASALAVPGPPSRFEQDDPLIAYYGSWSSAASDAYSGGSLAFGRGDGTAYTADFTGPSIAIIARTGPSYGVARVTLDGGSPQMVDLHAASYAQQQSVWSAAGLDDTTHTVLVEWTGVVSGGGDYINIDALDVGGTLVARVRPEARFEQTDDRIAYGGTWSSASSPSYSGGSFGYARGAGSGFSADFFGTGVSIIARRGPCFGIARVTVDGGAPELVDLYSASYLQRQTVWTKSGLADGRHTVVVEWTGSKTGAGDYVDLDALDVLGTLAPSSFPVRHEQDDARLALVGPWSTAASSLYSGGSLAYVRGAGSRVTADFDGTSFGLVARTGPGYGVARVTLDGQPPVMVDLWTSAYKQKQVVFYRYGLDPGPHSVLVEWTGLRTGSADYINVDAVDAGGALAPARVEQTDPGLAFSGTWTTVSSPAYSGGSMAYARGTGAKVTASFTGASVGFLARTGPSYGVAKVTLDGVPEFVDLYSANYAQQQPVWFTPGLTWGPHTLAIEWTGTRTGPGDYISLDAIDLGGVLTPVP